MHNLDAHIGLPRISTELRGDDFGGQPISQVLISSVDINNIQWIKIFGMQNSVGQQRQNLDERPNDKDSTFFLDHGNKWGIFLVVKNISLSSVALNSI